MLYEDSYLLKAKIRHDKTTHNITVLGYNSVEKIRLSILQIFESTVQNWTFPNYSLTFFDNVNNREDFISRLVGSQFLSPLSLKRIKFLAGEFYEIFQQPLKKNLVSSCVTISVDLVKLNIPPL